MNLLRCTPTRVALALTLLLSGWVHAENRLGQETSPYLRLHAHNPVDWYPWGPEALAKAKRENKVIFLSVGYSSCHWCHVMERESFMDEEIAKFLNDHFVCIKVDREERPDVDSIYMLAVQIDTGRGGWPISEFLTPDAKPFYSQTYLPARDGDRPPARGFFNVAQGIKDLWQTKEKELRQRADQVTGAIKHHLEQAEAPTEDIVMDTSVVDKVQRALVQEFDPQYGGFGFDPARPTLPKFPEPSNLLLLLERARGGDERAQQMVERSLDKMQSGGIWDHVAGGFHRYSVDRFWHIPHFEKMLYDNGQLAVVYTQAYELTGKMAYRRVVERTLDFVLREMRDPQGGFYAALDAESENVEGKFYRWEKDEVQKILGERDYAFWSAIYGFNDTPNFEKHYVPELAKSLQELAQQQQTSEATLWQRLAPLHEKLRVEHEKRPRPLTDTKILAGWNGLMIRGFADAGRVLEQPRYVEAAQKAAEFVMTHMRQPDGRLYRTHTAKQARLNAYLDDYAFLCDGLLALHRATGDRSWLQAADELTQLQIQYYHDPARGGFFFTSSDHEELIARGRQPSDGALPAGNSVSAQNLLRLSKLLDKPEYNQLAGDTIASVLPQIVSSPRIAPRMTLVLARWLEDQSPQ